MKKETISIATFDLEIDDSNPMENLNRVLEIVNSFEADLFLFPELFTTGYETEKWIELSKSSNEILKILSNLKKSIGFSILWNENGVLSNRFFLTGKKEFYDKAHLFKPMREDKFLKGGEELVSMKLEGFQISPTICYDLRFPEMYRKLALSGTDIFLIPAEWPKPRCSVLHTLAQSRAIENQAILVLSNRVGKDSSKVEYCGGSGIFLPDGTFLEGNRVHKIDFKEVLKNRKFIQPLTERVEGVDF